MQYPEPISKLIDSYMRLPGIGAKTATRLAFYTIDMNKDDVTVFAKSLVAAKEDLHYCSICGNITDEDPCAICRDKNRDQSTILVVEQPKDVMSIDRAQDYHGLYHVLHGVLSPIEGRGPEDLNIEYRRQGSHYCHQCNARRGSNSPIPCAPYQAGWD